MHRVALAGFSVVVGLAAGCSSMGMVVSGGKAAARMVIGAEAKVRALEELSVEEAGSYQGIQLGEVTTDVPPIVPADKLAVIRTEMEVKLGEESKKAFPEGGRALLATVVARFLKERGTFGGDARLDMIATLVDADTKSEVATLFIEGFSNSPTAGKAEDMARENAKELVRYLAKARKGEKND